MIRRWKLFRANLVRAAARTIYKAMSRTRDAATQGTSVRGTLRLGGPLHLYRTKTYIFIVRHYGR